MGQLVQELQELQSRGLDVRNGQALGEADRTDRAAGKAVNNTWESELLAVKDSDSDDYEEDGDYDSGTEEAEMASDGGGAESREKKRRRLAEERAKAFEDLMLERHAALHTMCKEAGLPVTGNKATLANRLAGARFPDEDDGPEDGDSSTAAGCSELGAEDDGRAAQADNCCELRAADNCSERRAADNCSERRAADNCSEDNCSELRAADNCIECRAADNFLPSASFTGSMHGMCFKLGSRGLGYYSDIVQLPQVPTTPLSHTHSLSLLKLTAAPLISTPLSKPILPSSLPPPLLLPSLPPTHLNLPAGPT